LSGLKDPAYGRRFFLRLYTPRRSTAASVCAETGDGGNTVAATAVINARTTG
jgi:hypothetical protein